MTAKIYDFDKERAVRAADLSSYDALGCPICQKLTAPLSITTDITVKYRCDSGHKWRIDESGASSMRGHVGKRYYPSC